MVSLVSDDALHQLHIFVFFLAVFHVAFSALTMSLGRAKVWLVLTSCCFPFPQKTERFCFYTSYHTNKHSVLFSLSMQTRIWKEWEKETCSPTYEFVNGSIYFDWLLFRTLYVNCVTYSCVVLFSYPRIIVHVHSECLLSTVKMVGFVCLFAI